MWLFKLVYITFSFCLTLLSYTTSLKLLQIRAAKPQETHSYLLQLTSTKKKKKHSYMVSRCPCVMVLIAVLVSWSRLGDQLNCLKPGLVKVYLHYTNLFPTCLFCFLASFLKRIPSGLSVFQGFWFDRNVKSSDWRSKSDIPLSNIFWHTD